MAIKVTVRDGRMGRDPGLVDDEGGEVLMAFEAARPLDVGDRLTLPDGAEVVVIGLTEHLGGADGWGQVVFVGDVWKASEPPSRSAD